MIFGNRLQSVEGKLSETKVTIRKLLAVNGMVRIHAWYRFAGLQGNAYIQTKIFP